MGCVHGGVDFYLKVPIVGKSLTLKGGATHAKFAKMLQQYREGVDKQADVKKHTKNPCDSLHLNYCPIGARRMSPNRPICPSIESAFSNAENSQSGSWEWNMQRISVLLLTKFPCLAVTNAIAKSAKRLHLQIV